MASESNAGLMNEDELRAYATELENKLERIESICKATQKDTSEIRWVRMFAGDILKVIANERD